MYPVAAEKSAPTRKNTERPARCDQSSAGSSISRKKTDLLHGFGALTRGEYLADQELGDDERRQRDSRDHNNDQSVVIREYRG
jgi:hypothetical protein